MPYKLKVNGQGNPYGLQLVDALTRQGTISAVQHGSEWIRHPPEHYDIIHFQWPEAIYGFRSPTDDELQQLSEALRVWTKKSRIVTTIHNEFPHFDENPEVKEQHKQLYDLIYRNTDGFIHLGKASEKIVRKRFSNYLNQAEETVIRHGNYRWFPNDTKKPEARKWLGIEGEKQLLLTFGFIRKKDELQYLKSGLRNFKNRKSYWLHAGRLPYVSRKYLSYYTTRIPLWLKKGLEFREEFIPYEEVQYYLNGADLLLVPRLDSLNSGNVPLGFTFGKVVVGPDRGVMGEMLEETGNPRFDPEQPVTLAEAIREGLQLADSGKGEENRVYAEKQLGWSRIARQHCDFYTKLL